MTFDILSTARGFQKIAGKVGGVEYLILNFYTPRGHVQWNVQSIGDIISFRIYDSYFHHDVRGHSQGVRLPRSMRMDLFFFFVCLFAIFLQIFPSFSLFVSLFLFSFFIGHLSHFCFGLAYSLRQAGLLKKDKVKVDFQNSIFQVFFGI